jgi:hypothetical protein
MSSVSPNPVIQFDPYCPTAEVGEATHPARAACLMAANTIQNWKYPTISVTQKQP